MFGYKLIKNKDLEDLREMQTEVLEALKSIDVLLKIDDLIDNYKH